MHNQYENLMKVVPILIQAGITGFESPAAEYSEKTLNLNDLIHNPGAVFVWKAIDNSMQSVGIYKYDYLICDSSAEPEHNDVVVVQFEDTITCRLLDLYRRLLVSPFNDAKPIKISEEHGIEVKGVVTFSIRCHRYNVQHGNEMFDLNELIVHPSSSYIGSASGSSMEGVGIYNSDLLLVDRRLEVKDKDIVVVNLNNEFACKQLDIPNRMLLSANPEVSPIKINYLDTFSLEGVVTCSLRRHRLNSFPGVA